MKKIISLLAVLTLLLSAMFPALALAQTGEVISRQVSLRKKSSTSSDRICYLPHGTEFEILSSNGNMYEVSVENPKKAGEMLTGWVESAYIIENPTHIVLRNRSGVYAYAAPYSTTKRVGDVSLYQRFTVIGTQGSYYVVSFREAVCFLPMNADYWVEEDIAPIVNGSSTPFMTTVKTSVRAYDNAKAAVVATYNANTPVDVLYITAGGWAAIRYNKVIAFIHLDDLAPSN